jgi:arylsulfatase A-like enzyme
MAAGKGKFVALAVPGSLDWQSIPDKEKSEDPQVTDAALEMIHSHRPQVMFVHLPTVDNVGHAQGWATAAQLAAIEQADACIGRILSALSEEKVLDHTLVIVTADHGGAGRIHGPDDARSRHIPWIAVGPGIRQNLDLTTNGDLVIDTEDTFATACYVLGIPVMRRVDGKPITQIVQRDELLQAK